MIDFLIVLAVVLLGIATFIGAVFALLKIIRGGV